MLEVKRIIVGPIKTNCYLASSLEEAAVIDPGGDSGRILAVIEKMKKTVKYIINTHAHYDHVLADQKIKAATHAQILIHAQEKDYIKFIADEYLQAGDKIKIGADEMEVILTPGHTPGGICLLGEGMIFTGDTLFADGYGRIDLAGGSESEMEKSLARLKQIIKPGMRVYPGHGETFIA